MNESFAKSIGIVKLRNDVRKEGAIYIDPDILKDMVFKMLVGARVQAYYTNIKNTNKFIFPTIFEDTMFQDSEIWIRNSPRSRQLISIIIELSKYGLNVYFVRGLSSLENWLYIKNSMRERKKKVIGEIASSNIIKELSRSLGSLGAIWIALEAFKFYINTRRKRVKVEALFNIVNRCINCDEITQSVILIIGDIGSIRVVLNPCIIREKLETV